MQRKQQIKLNIFERFNKAYPNLLKAITSFSKIIFTFLKTSLTTIALPLALTLLIIVEVIRLEHGIILFENSQSIALFGAIAIVFLNLIIEFMIIYVERVNGFIKDDNYDGSLRILFSEILYKIGIGKNFKKRVASPAKQFKNMQVLVTFTIIILAFAGSMHEEILAEGDTVWHVALLNIFLYSNLNTIISWFSGLLFTFSAVLASQMIARYIAYEAFEAEDEIVVKAESASLKERGIIHLTIEQAKSKIEGIRELDNLKDSDKIQIKPTLRFFDGEKNKWFGNYKRKGAFVNMLVNINKQREKTNE